MPNNANEFYLVGYEPHTAKHKALGPYADDGIQDAARGVAFIRNELTEDGRYPHLEVEVAQVRGARDPQHAWHLFQRQLRGRGQERRLAA